MLSPLNWLLLAALSVSLLPLALRYRRVGSLGDGTELTPPAADAATLDHRLRGRLLLTGAILVYLTVILVGIERFPIYFFADEAAQTVLAERLVQGRWRVDGQLLPTYFYNVDKFSLSTSVYWQLPGYLLFGKQVWVTRVAAALGTLLAALALSLMLRNVWRVPYWWSPALLLPLAPAWFIHARSAFETSLASSLLLMALYLYLRYLGGRPRGLYGAIVLAALAFYAYNPMRIIVPGLVLLLAVLDWRHHAKNERTAFRGWWLIVLMAWPYLRFLLAESGTELEHLDLVQTHWLQDIPLVHKLYLSSVGYSHGLNPFYWFLPNPFDIIRHRLPADGHLPLALLPLCLLGLMLLLRRWRDPNTRALLLALALAPAAGLVALPLVTRVLLMVPLLVLVSAMGLSWLMAWLETGRMSRAHLAAILFALLAGANLLQLRLVLRDGPTAFDNYGLEGMQYGGPQYFGAARDLVAEEAGSRLALSVGWLNGPEMLYAFFLDESAPVEWDSILYYIDAEAPWDDQSIWLMPAEELDLAAESDAVGEIEILREIPLPDGRPGFYAARILPADG